TQVLGIVYRAISGHLIRKAGLTRASGVTGAVTLIQRFGSALNLNVHFHLLVLDGVYRREGEGRLRFGPVPAPTSAELNRLVQRIAERIGRSLERSGLIARDIENAYLVRSGRGGADQQSARGLDHVPDRDGAKRRAETVHAADAAGRAGWRAPGGGRKLRLFAARRHRRESLATGQARAPGTLRRKAAGRHRAAVADRGRARALRTEDA